MKYNLCLSLGTIACLASCEDSTFKKPARENTEEQVAGHPVAMIQEQKSTFDFKAMMTLIDRINKSGSYEFFQTEWAGLRSELQKTDMINALSHKQRSELWWAVEYMRSCVRAEILHDYNKEIIPILLSFDLPNDNEQLKEILIDSGQL